MKWITNTACCLLVGATAYAQQGVNCTIRGTSDIQEGIAILNDYKNPDTVQIVDGVFEFRRKIDKPQLVSFIIPPSRSTRLILEQADITIEHSTRGGYRMGGGPLNIRFQKIEDAISPLNERIRSSWALYNREEGAERIRIWRDYHAAREEKKELVKKLVLEDGGFAGLVQVKPIVRNDSYENLKLYLEAFREFSGERIYEALRSDSLGYANTAEGALLPGWTLAEPDGSLRSLSSFRGKYVLVDFWFSGCTWCRKMIPGLTNIYRDLKDKGFEIVSVSVDPPRDEIKWREAMEEDGAPWIQVWDPEKSLPPQYAISGYPTMFLIDPDGRVLQRIIGYHDEPILREFFMQHMGKDVSMSKEILKRLP